MRRILFGNHSGSPIYKFQLENNNRTILEVSNLGANITGIFLPDKDGELENIVLSYNTLDEYLSDEFYVGATIAPVANRITSGEFFIDGIKYCINKNESNSANHSSAYSYSKKIFDYKENTEDNCIEFIYVDNEDRLSPFWGIELHVIYRLSENNEIAIEYRAFTQRKTIINVTNHSYFNLNPSSISILDHQISIKSIKKIETDLSYLPTGKILFVKNDIVNNHKNVNPGMNDYYFDFPNSSACISLCCLENNRRLDVFTNYPGILVYTGDFLGAPFAANQGICFEAQCFPDAPNRPEFPNIFLDSGETYSYFVKYKLYN